MRHAAATNVITCNGLQLAPLPLVLPASVLASLESPPGGGADRLFRPLAKRVSSWLTKQQVVLMPPGLRHFVPNLTALDRANVSFCHGNKERELALAKRIRNLTCSLPDHSECQVARVYVELPLSPLPPPSEMQYGSKVVFAQAWMPFEFLRSTKGKDIGGVGAGSARNSSFVTMQVDGVRYSRVAFSAVISPPASPTTGGSGGGDPPASSPSLEGGGGSTDGGSGGPASPGSPADAAQLLPQVALRWDPVERPPGAPPAFDTALRVFSVGSTALAEGPIELRWFPGVGDPSASADDRTLGLAERSRRAALRSISEAWFSYAHLAKVPMGGSGGSGGGDAQPVPPPRVDDFDRRGVVITHTSDDATGGLASEVMDASKPLPDMRLVHLSRGGWKRLGRRGGGGQRRACCERLLTNGYSLAHAPRLLCRCSLLLVAHPAAQGAARRQGQGRRLADAPLCLRVAPRKPLRASARGARRGARRRRRRRLHRHRCRRRQQQQQPRRRLPPHDRRRAVRALRVLGAHGAPPRRQPCISHDRLLLLELSSICACSGYTAEPATPLGQVWARPLQNDGHG